MVRSEDTGKLILRLALGILILMHGIAKLSKGVDGIAGMLTSHGVPGVVAYLVFVGEIVAPVLIIMGLFTRPAAWIVVINMLFAFWLVHSRDLMALGSAGGWKLELQGMYLFGALALAFLGAGRFSVGGDNGRFN